MHFPQNRLLSQKDPNFVARRRIAVVYDFLPDEQLREAVNLADFRGMFVFDKWTCDTNGRQAIFFRAKGETRYQAQMIDQGFCFNAGEWTFPDALIVSAWKS